MNKIYIKNLLINDREDKNRIKNIPYLFNYRISDNNFTNFSHLIKKINKKNLKKFLHFKKS